jgi:transcriptional regulator with XRE-family HTH domain
MAPVRHPGVRLRAFREARKLSLREAARQLHATHPALKDWEDGGQTPMAPYRDAIEVWTSGDVRSDSWPLEGREKQIAENAARVKPADESGPHAAAAPTVADIAPQTGTS